jgi:hypothetical protein
LHARDGGSQLFRASDTQRSSKPECAHNLGVWRAAGILDFKDAPVGRLHDFVPFDRRPIAVQMPRMFFNFFMSFTDSVSINTLLILPL